MIALAGMYGAGIEFDHSSRADGEGLAINRHGSLAFEDVIKLRGALVIMLLGCVNADEMEKGGSIVARTEKPLPPAAGAFFLLDRFQPPDFESLGYIFHKDFLLSLYIQRLCLNPIRRLVNSVIQIEKGGNADERNGGESKDFTVDVAFFLIQIPPKHPADQSRRCAAELSQSG